MTDPLEEIERALATGADLASDVLFALAGLDGEDLDRFRRTWQDLDRPSRVDLLTRLGEAAEDNVVLDFAAVYRLGLDDPDPGVREQAFRLAAEEADLRLLDVYLRAATSDPDPDARAGALEALGAFTLAAQTEGWPATDQERLERTLVDALHGANADASVRRAALLSLAYLTTPRAEAEIRQAHLQPDLREWAVLAMGRNCQDVWLDDLRAELEAEEPAIRRAAAEAASEMEDQRLVTSLIARVEDRDSEVQEAAIRALGVIGGGRAKGALSELLQARDRRLRTAAREAIDQLLYGDDPLARTSE